MAEPAPPIDPRTAADVAADVKKLLAVHLGYDLRLMSVDTADSLVDDGCFLVIVALVGTNLHVRIFDANGKRVVNKAENELISGEKLTTLKKQLNPLPDGSGLSREQRQKIIRDATSIAGHTLHEWKPGNDRLGTALVAVFARFAELVIERLNQAPDKNLLAFLDLLGSPRLPPQPARVPLSFSLAEGAVVDTVVPAGTQVGAAGDGQPLLFETERDLVVTSVRLAAVLVRDPGAGKYVDHSAALAAETPADVAVFQGAEAILYLGFSLPPRRTFPNRPLSLYFSVAETEHRYEATVPAPPPLVWEYWNGDWAGTAVQDETEALAQSGVVIWLAPADIARKADFGLPEPDLYWLRLRPAGGVHPNPPRLRRLVLNTTMAAETLSLNNEVLGSSDGSKGQRFRANHAPILPGPVLLVQEAELPTAAEQDAIRRAEGERAIRASEATAARKGFWVRWHEVPDFYGSDPCDRHYVLDHLKGELRFGDGRNGLVPPRGIGNIRLARYRTGGGARGNVPPGAVSQLKTTVPYVDRVTNWEPAQGGADAEPLAALRARAPRQLRHGYRAVTRDDYEDLALLASPEVARAKCVPLWDRYQRDLFDPSQDSRRSVQEKHAQPGHVTVLIVPRSAAAEPRPSIELVRRVRDYLDKHRLPGVTLHVVGPEYLEIGVTAEIIPASPEAATFLQSAVEDALASFLHPLRGGPAGAGWPFGRNASTAALYQAIHAVPGVAQVRTLKRIEIPPPARAGLQNTGYFLVRSGRHAISLVRPD